MSENMNQSTHQNTNQNGVDRNSIFSFFYRNRVHVTKNGMTIMNVSILFMLLSLLCAPWLVIIGAIAALALGYRFSLERNAKSFSGSFDTVFQNAAGNVRNAAESFVQKEEGGSSEDAGNQA